MLLGLDIGTTTISGVGVEERNGEVVAISCRPHDEASEESAGEGGIHEQDPERVLEAAFAVLEELAGLGPVKGVALTGQMHGLVGVDANLGPVTNLVTWRDRRSIETGGLLERHGHEAETGCFLHPGYGGVTLHHWLKTGAFPREARRVLSVPGFVAAVLTGISAIDETLAASWGLWNLQAGDWHAEVIRHLGIPRELLPEALVGPCQLGETRSLSGLGLPPGTPVFNPIGDNQAGVMGAMGQGHATAVINVGTSSQLSFWQPGFDFDPRFETRPYPGGGSLRVFSTLCGGWSLAYLADFFRQVTENIGGVIQTRDEVFERLLELADQSGDGGSGGLEVDPRFAGQRGSGMTLTGSITGITTTNLTPSKLVNGFVEGIVSEIAGGERDMDLSQVRELALIGNAGRRFPVLRKVIETRFGLPCRVPETPEEAAFGAACAVSMGGA